MSKSYIELKELTYDIITNAFIKALADIDKGTVERDKHFVAATELIIKNFKAHIASLPKPENPHEKSILNDKGEYKVDTPYELVLAAEAYLGGAEDFLKALMESLE